MLDRRMASNLLKLESDVKLTVLTFEQFLDKNAFYQEHSKAGIYICTYKKDPRYVYIGKTNDFPRRWKEHERDLIKNCHAGWFQEFYNENQCTPNDFEWKILDQMENDGDKISVKEKARIREYDESGQYILLNTIKYRR